MFELVQLPAPDGTLHAHWDGLLAQNPPVRNLLTGTRQADRKPDEIWAVRINPREHRGSLESLEAIEDCRTELAGNRSLHQELHFINQENTWISKGVFTREASDRYKHVTVRDRTGRRTTRLGRRPGQVDQTRPRPEVDRRPHRARRTAGLGFLLARTSDEFVLVG